VVFAAVSAYWGVGGTWLMDTIGGSLERQARARHTSAVVVLLTVAGVKLIAAVLPLVALRGLASPVWSRRVRVLAWTEAAILTGYGVVYTGVGLLVQSGVIDVPATANHRAFAWHAYLWDPWFLVWGLLVTGALLRNRHDRNPTPTQERTEMARIAEWLARRPAHTPTHAEGFPRWEHESSFTFEGEIERLGAIGRNMSTAPRWARLVARSLALMVLLVVAYSLVDFLVRVVG